MEGRWKDRSVSQFARYGVLVLGDVDGIVGRWRYCDGVARFRDEGFMRRLRCRGSMDGLILCSRGRISDSDVGSRVSRGTVGVVVDFWDFFFLVPARGVLSTRARDVPKVLLATTLLSINVLSYYVTST